MKEVVNTQYVACMNPTAGSFHITPRMQRHFATFAVQMPSADITRRASSPPSTCHWLRPKNTVATVLPLEDSRGSIQHLTSYRNSGV